MRLMELLIDEETEDFGVEAISLVQFPAIEENFIYMNKNGKPGRYALAKMDEERQLLVGPALIPDKEIPRFDEMKDEQYNVYFSKETVAQAAALFMKQKRVDSYTAEHEKPVQGLSIFESWIIQDKEQDKSNLYGFDLPEGTWMVSVYVGNDEVWQGVKEGEYKGFSIEGYFVDRLVKMQQEVSKEDIAEAVREALVPAKVLDGDPLFQTARAANLYAEAIGCKGHHIHSVDGTKYYMPCETHAETKERRK